jgi:hypothetical protein
LFITPEYSENNVKVAFYGVLPAGLNRGIGKILLSTVFKLIPSVKRIFLHTRSSNETAINSYLSWGFTEFNSDMPNWPNFEYLAESSDELQKLSQKID